MLRQPTLSFLTYLFAAIVTCFAQKSQAFEFVPWVFGTSTCQDCAIEIEILQDEIKTEKVEAFIETLESEKFVLIDLYESDPQEYNLLAHMAVGILGRESEFFTSARYHVKESSQWLVTAIKTINNYLNGSENGVSRNSRGPTQIKLVPGRIQDHYGYNEEDLADPRAAAVSTMGILIEGLRELKQRAKNNQWDFITPSTYDDYLPYIYFGGTRRIKDGSATPDKNIYVKEMKNYMSWVRIWEVPAPSNHRP